jgi:hypothetical protein
MNKKFFVIFLLLLLSFTLVMSNQTGWIRWEVIDDVHSGDSGAASSSGIDFTFELDDSEQTFCTTDEAGVVRCPNTSPVSTVQNKSIVYWLEELNAEILSLNFPVGKASVIAVDKTDVPAVSGSVSITRQQPSPSLETVPGAHRPEPIPTTIENINVVNLKQTTRK